MVHDALPLLLLQADVLSIQVAPVLPDVRVGHPAGTGYLFIYFLFIYLLKGYSPPVNHTGSPQGFQVEGR
ncbi:MAG: hypothetical protein KAG66_03690 [Methylococcales bacterium]|nr:hypothetical protein [Methylococcales bacterium]